MRLALTPLPTAEGRPAGRAVKLDRPILLVGRHPECDVIPRGSAKVSRRHCCVAEASGRVRVRDLGSMNGTFVNGRPVKREAPLTVGDVLRVGDAEYRLSPVGAGPAAGESGVISVAPSLSEPADLSDEQTVTAKDVGAESDSDVVPLSL